MKERRIPVKTSITECCFTNTVERQISTVNINAPAISFFLPFVRMLFLRDTNKATETKTCMLGTTIVGESTSYIAAIIREIKSVCVISGRKLIPLGKIIYTNRQKPVPKNK